MVTRILGPDGQPIASHTLATPQTSHLMHLHRAYQGHPSRGLTPSRLASILLAAEQGDLLAQFELYEDMEERDGHILSEMGKRRRAVSGLPWDIKPPPNPTPQEEDDAAWLKATLEGIEDFDSVLFDVTDAIGKGFACLEIEWQRDRSEGWQPRRISHRPQGWFQLYRGQVQEIRLRDNSGEGAPLLPFGWITHVHKARSGYLERASLFRALVWPYLFKNYSVGDLAEFLEIYGIPLRIGKYPPGASDKEKATLLRALVSVGHNAAGIIPDGMALDFHHAAQGDPAAFELMMDWCERTESKVILGATLTSQADRGSNTHALGNVHNEVRKELKDADAKQVGATLTRDLVYPIAALNGRAPGGYRRCPRFVFDIAEMKDLSAYAAALPSLVNLGMRIPRSWAHTELGIPESEEGDTAILQPQAAPQTPIETPVNPARPPLKAAATAITAQPELAPDAPARMAGQLQTQAAGLRDWIESIRVLLDTVETLEQFRDGLLTLYPEMRLEQYAEAMALAATAAHLAGQSEVQDGLG